MKNKKTDSYSKIYLKDTLYLLGCNIKDLEEWSVYNSDKYLDEIIEIKKMVEKLANKI